MRYLTHLARETTAVIKPRLTPSWLDAAIPFTAPTATQESTADLNTEAAGPSGAEGVGGRDTRVARAGAAAKSGRRDDAGIESQSRAAATPGHADARRVRSEAASLAQHGSDFSSAHSVAARSRRATLAREVSIEQTGDPDSREERGNDGAARRDATAARDDVRRDVRAGEATAAGLNPPATLQPVLNELARRQKLLDVRLESSLGGAPVHESSTPRTQARDADEPRLEIGSIVVQVMPEPPTSPAPRATKLRQIIEPDRRWARSFLDRST
jgi:hypothetical protein